MNNNYQNSLDQMFDGNAPLSADGLKGFFEESLEFVQELQKKLSSPDEKVREEALQSALEIKGKLEAKLQNICEKSGIDLAQLAALSESAANMTLEEQKTIEEMEKKFQALKKDAS